MSSKQLIPAIALLLLISACASSNRLDNEMFRIESTPAAATATLSTGQSCQTPCSLELPRGEKFRVTIHKKGYKPFTKTINSVKTTTGGRPASASVSVGGVFRVPVGPKSGASYDLEPNPLVVELEVRN